MVDVGFSGSRGGMSPSQDARVRSKLLALFEPGSVFRHGLCVGADVQAARIAKGIGYRTVAHPGPSTSRWRARDWVDDEALPERPFLQRNRDIVDACDVMVAAPRDAEDPGLGSGTWHTIRYCHKVERSVTVFAP